LAIKNESEHPKEKATTKEENIFNDRLNGVGNCVGLRGLISLSN